MSRTNTPNELAATKSPCSTENLETSATPRSPTPEEDRAVREAQERLAIAQKQAADVKRHKALEKTAQELSKRNEHLLQKKYFDLFAKNRTSSLETKKEAARIGAENNTRATKERIRPSFLTTQHLDEQQETKKPGGNCGCMVS